MATQKSKYADIDPVFLEKEYNATLRVHRKVVLFNSRERAAIREYCRRFNISNESGMIRQAVMERVLQGLDEVHPSLFE